MYSIVEFNIASDNVITLEVSGAQEPNDVTITHTDGTTVLATPVISSPPSYTYQVVDPTGSGIVKAVMDAGLTDETTATIANLSVGATCALNKTLNENYDCVLAQQLWAVERYVKDNKDNSARVLYNLVETSCLECTTLSTPQEVSWYLSIINGEYTK